ncbi:MAG: hypothetical protein RLZZ450_4497 [Pseudomonadota bacterium]|jgi:hypothetical protein
MSEALVAAWARAFLVTQLVEAPVYHFGFGAPLSAALAASTLTHPIVWFVFFGPFEPLASLSYGQRLVLAEVFAWLVEALLLCVWTGRRRALAWSLLANGSSVAMSYALRAMFGFP